MNDIPVFTNTPAVPDVRNLAIYQAVVDPGACGVSSDNQLVFGLRLQLVYVDGHDLLAELLENCGADATDGIVFPAAGLTPGALYTPVVANVSHDWESGHVDGWDVELQQYTDAIPDLPAEIQE